MKEPNTFVQFIADQMQDAGSISYKSMFGGYAFYCDRKVVALVCNNELFVKPTANGRRIIGETIEKPPYPGAKPYFAVQGKVDDKEWMSQLIRATAAELPSPKQPTPKAPHRRVKKQKDTAQ